MVISVDVCAARISKFNVYEDVVRFKKLKKCKARVQIIRLLLRICVLLIVF